jgi:hypothetical protein
VPGVTNVVVSFEDKTAVVTYDDSKAQVDALVKATTNAGYPSAPKLNGLRGHRDKLGKIMNERCAPRGNGKACGFASRHNFTADNLKIPMFVYPAGP